MAKQSPHGPIRLIQIIDRLNVGGSARHVLLAARALESRGYRTVLLKGQVEPGEAEMEDVILQTGVAPREVCGLGRAISILQDWRAFAILYRTLRTIHPDVVETHKSKAGVLGRLAAWLAGVPVVAHVFHGHVFHGYFSPWKSRLIVLVERLFAHRTDAIIAVSHQQRRELLGYRIAPPSRLHAVPYGLQLAPYLSCKRTDGGFRGELGFGDSVPLVGTVTRLVPIKGVEVFLRAAQCAAQEVPEARFVVVGDGELREPLEALTRQLGLEGRVCFAGFRRDLVRIYGALDLMVLSSFNEGLPLAIIEAIAAGCYVVASRVGGVSDLIQDGRVGLTVAPGDAEALSNAMVLALREGRRVSPSERRRAGRLYGIDRMTEDLDLLYRRLLKNKQSRQAEEIVPAACREGIKT